jgi:ribokinase
MLTVFGSLNVDVSVRTSRMPKPGETLPGHQALVSPGGKGANQAHAAALFGTPTCMHGAVGNDDFAKIALSLLRTDGVDVSGVETSPNNSTGLAVITIDASGENSIIVAAGANDRANAANVPDALLARSKVLLLQLEVPWSQSKALAQRAKRFNCHVIINPSPLPANWDITPGIADTLIVNQVEMDQLCSQLRIGGHGCQQQAVLLARVLNTGLLVTLGADGSLLAHADGSVHTVRATKLHHVLDTTGAGDTYAGVFAAALANDHLAKDAMEFASAASGLACLKMGAQTAQPDRAAIQLAVADRERRR